MKRPNDDHFAWPEAAFEDLWIYDKLILSVSQGHICGPAGIDVPSPGRYIVKPITNILGMGRSAEIKHLEESTDHLPPGHFWCEIFSGRHLSVDYIDGEQTLCVEGHRKPGASFWAWDRWEKVEDKVPYPLDKKLPKLNCEFIGGKLIEAHLRLNPDFMDVPENVQELKVVWKNQSVLPPKGWKWKKDEEWLRIGFFMR